MVCASQFGQVMWGFSKWITVNVIIAEILSELVYSYILR